MTHSGDFDGAIALGRQMTVEFYDCSAAILADVKKMENVFLEAARVSGAHVINSNFHAFEPQGVSGVLVISESHFAVHAWPEHDYAAVDLFTCGSGVDFDLAVRSLGEGMRSGRWIISSLVNRGILRDSGELERLVPVVENSQNSGLQLSWSERFRHSEARAISACIDVYNCGDRDWSSETAWREFAEKLAQMLCTVPNGNPYWKFESDGLETTFVLNSSQIRLSGVVNHAEKNVYLDVFSVGFSDPRPIAERALTLLGGTYYRMQVQIRQ